VRESIGQRERERERQSIRETERERETEYTSEGQTFLYYLIA